MPTIDDYLGLITSEHADKPNFRATVALSLQPCVGGQNLLLAMPGLYDLDVSVGAQEDADGLWIGISRYVSQPLGGVYFSWGTSGLGWGQGVWKGEFDPAQGVVRLDDETYRILLRARAIANAWDGTTAGAMPSLVELFSGSATPGVLPFIQDNFDMSMSFVIAGDWPNALFLAVFASGALGLKPASVKVNYLKVSLSGSPVFGWGMSNQYVSGWGTGAWAVPA